MISYIKDRLPSLNPMDWLSHKGNAIFISKVEFDNRMIIYENIDDMHQVPVTLQDLLESNSINEVEAIVTQFISFHKFDQWKNEVENANTQNL